MEGKSKSRIVYRTNMKTSCHTSSVQLRPVAYTLWRKKLLIMAKGFGEKITNSIKVSLKDELNASPVITHHGKNWI